MVWVELAAVAMFSPAQGNLERPTVVLEWRTIDRLACLASTDGREPGPDELHIHVDLRASVEEAKELLAPEECDMMAAYLEEMAADLRRH
jgi:hypothetical protein